MEAEHKQQNRLFTSQLAKTNDLGSKQCWRGQESHVNRMREMGKWEKGWEPERKKEQKGKVQPKNKEVSKG